MTYKILYNQELDPKIKKIVDWCNEHGFRTTDSGDGESKPADERTIDGSHVVIILDDPNQIIKESNRLKSLVQQCWPDSEARIEASYSPYDGIGVILLMGVHGSHKFVEFNLEPRLLCLDKCFECGGRGDLTFKGIIRECGRCKGRGVCCE